jgi:hypothetical protein
VEAIRELGERIGRAWLQHDHRDDDFAAIAHDALASSAFLSRVRPDALSDWFLRCASLPEQSFRDFGQPALTLYRGHRFYVELLYWLESTTAIHQHSFAGAFGVLSGSSLHSRYAFTPKDRRKSEIVFGDLALERVEVLAQGDVRPIAAGEGLIHSLFHLDHPTLTVVVRTDTVASRRPQYSYCRSGIGHDPTFAPEPFATQLRLLDALRQVGNADFWRHAQEALGRSDVWMAWGILNIAHKSRAQAGWGDLVSTARQRLGERADRILAAIEERARDRLIIDRRRDVHDPELRYCLALLLNLPDRASIFAAVRQRFAQGDPEDRMIGWAAALAERQVIGVGLDALGLKMLRYALRGLPLAAVRRELERVFGSAAVAPEAARLTDLWHDIVADPVLAPLFVAGVREPAETADRETQPCTVSG